MTIKMKKEILDITNQIIERSKDSRAKYLAKIKAENSQTVHRAGLSCGNLAHGFAACGKEDKASLINKLDTIIIN